MAPLTPDFIQHPWVPLAEASLANGFVSLAWTDGFEFTAYSLWLAENAEGMGLDSSSRESTLEPNQLPDPSDLLSVEITREGALGMCWTGGKAEVHPGWLRHIGESQHLPNTEQLAPIMWTATTHNEPPTIDGANILNDETVFEEWLRTLVTHGLCRLVNTPKTLDFVGELVGSVGPIRDTNFGHVWSVQASPDPDSTANTGLDLGQHSDIPTREVPPASSSFIASRTRCREAGRGNPTGWPLWTPSAPSTRMLTTP